MISIDTTLDEKLPKFSNNHPIARTKLASFLKYLFHESEFHAFKEKYPHLEGFDFVEQVLDYFDFGYRVFDREMERIPTTGKVVIVANHPLGSLDGLALLKLVREVRPDVRVIANDVLQAIEPLHSLLIPVDNRSNKTRKKSIKHIKNWLNSDGAVILFPAGAVSRLGPSGLKDGRWNSGFIRFAQRANAPILPLFINGRNSLFFYALSLLSKPASTLWLVREMFKQANRHIDIRVGHLVYPEQYESIDLNLEAKAKLFKKYVYKLAKGKSLTVFEPEYEAVAHPESRQQLKKEIGLCECLGETPDNKKIHLYRYQTNSVVMREIGRLREMTFRSVKEGSGKRRDVDAYDNYYDHIILWDENDLEIVGSYRMVRTAHAMSQDLEQPLYTQTLFNFHSELEEKLKNSLELGRSFVQPKYWGKRSLDYLWFGIGAYLRKYPDLEYMFGSVSISAAYSNKAKNLLTHFYSTFFGTNNQYVVATNPYKLTDKKQAKLGSLYVECEGYKSCFSVLKKAMAENKEAVPTLFKQYTEVVEEGGIEFAAFNVDHDFSDCVDGFIVVDISKLKASKRKRYIG